MSLRNLLFLLLNDFNSIKVRLELIISDTTRLIHGFQFHKGAIRTLSRGFYKAVGVTFQFHKGAIRTCSRCLCFW